MQKKGVTLVEILTVVALSALLMTAIIPFIRSLNESWTVGSSKSEILQNGRVALETMTRYIRQAARITRIPGSSGNYIKLRDRDDKYNIIFYHNVSGSPYYIGNSGLIKLEDLVMLSDSTGSNVDSLLASSLQSLNFNFFKDDGTSASQAREVRSVDVEMQLTDPLGVISDSLNLESSVCARQDVKISLWAINSGSTSAPLYDRLTNIAYEAVADGFRITTAVSECIAANPRDDSCWVADRTNNRIRKISSSGAVLWTQTGFLTPLSVSVNSDSLVNARETVWVADGNTASTYRIRRIYWTGTTWTFDTIGQGLFATPKSVSVNPRGVDNNQRETCWVADGSATATYRIRRIYWTGTTWTFDTIGQGFFAAPKSVSVNPDEIINGRNTCWVADGNSNTTYRVRKIYWTGSAYAYSTLSMGTGSIPRSVSVNTSDNTCWVANQGNNATYGNRVKKIRSDNNAVLWTVTGFSSPYSVSVNPADDTCWVADYNNNRVVRIDASGNIDWTMSGFSRPMAVSVSPNL